ncbi:hypothetical protein MOQ26_23450, partial [Stenotrophomonas maltophilia]|nr:hypothetical protein [Stenotrophomonas maltophilia]
EPEWSYSTGEPAAFFRPHLARACVVLPLRDGWDATKATLKRNLKESLRRSRNRLAKDGRPWTVTTLTDGIDAAAVDRFLDLHRRRSQLESGVHHG